MKIFDGHKSAAEFLEYRTYAYNRSKHPSLEPKDYASLFSKWKSFEKKYQTEKNVWDEEVKMEMISW